MRCKSVWICAGFGVLSSLGLTDLARASGLDVFRQTYSVLFETGNVIQFDGGYVKPSISGTIKAPGMGQTGGIVPAFGALGISAKYDFTNSLSAAIIGEQLHRAPLEFTNYPLYGKTGSNLRSDEYTALLRYKFNETWSVFGGLRVNNAKADLTTFGLESTMSSSLGFGYTAGIAYDDTMTGAMARIAYKSAIDHTMDGSGLLLTPLGPALVKGPIDFKLPQSVMADVRYPVFDNKTFALGSVTWTNWAATKLRPAQNTGVPGFSVTNYDDAWMIEGGLARFLDDNWVLAGWVSYDTGSQETPGLDVIYSNLVTYSGSLSYLGDNFRITGTFGYTNVGNTSGNNASLGGADVNYADNKVLVYRLQTVYRF